MFPVSRERQWSTSLDKGPRADIVPAMPLDKLLGDLLSSPTSGKLSGNSLAGLLLNKKTSKKIKKNAVRLGGAAALAGVGYLAYQEWQKSQRPPSASTPSTPPPLPGEAASGGPPPLPFENSADQTPPLSGTDERDALAMKLVQAMIGAAHADGQDWVFRARWREPLGRPHRR